MNDTKNGLRLIKLSIDLIIASVSSIVIYLINLDLIKQASKDALTQLGLGFGKIVLIPLYIIFYIICIGFTIRSFFLSIGLFKADSKLIKVLGVILFILTLVLIAFIGFNISQTVKIF